MKNIEVIEKFKKMHYILKFENMTKSKSAMNKVLWTECFGSLIIINTIGKSKL